MEISLKAKDHVQMDVAVLKKYLHKRWEKILLTVHVSVTTESSLVCFFVTVKLLFANYFRLIKIKER